MCQISKEGKKGKKIEKKNSSQSVNTGGVSLGNVFNMYFIDISGLFDLFVLDIWLGIINNYTFFPFLSVFSVMCINN